MGDITINPITVSRDLEGSAARAPRRGDDEGRRPGRVTAQQAPRPSAHTAPPASRAVERMDRAAARVLHVQPRPLVPQEAVATTDGRPFETALLVSAVRCTLRYIVLPFVLPLLGVATGATLGIVTGAALGLLLTLDVLAAIAIVATLRWQYLPLALALMVLVGFFFMRDARVLVA